MESWDSDGFINQLLMECDDTSISLPDIELEPHLLISQVRKYYMQYMIQLLSNNYETNQRLLNKNIYLPSAIWRCAKAIETKAAQTCMVVHLYRKNIVAVVKEIKNDTKRGKLNKKLFDYLTKPPQNEKKTQTKQSNDNQCDCNQSKRRRKRSDSFKCSHDVNSLQITSTSDNLKSHKEIYKIPVAINLNSATPQPVFVGNISGEQEFAPVIKTQASFDAHVKEKAKPQTQVSAESQNSDELLMQLEKLFQSDPNDDDIFEGALCDTLDSTTLEDHNKKENGVHELQIPNTQDNVIEEHAAQIKSLDERLATLAGLLVNNNDTGIMQQGLDCTTKSNKTCTNKWLCEEYFLKTKLYETLYQIGETNRKELERIKELFINLFGYDSDDEGVVSPLDETPEFVVSCKERIAPWVVKLLTPYYIKGRIRGKALFKALAKHLIRLIYQCSRYPQEYEVNSFVTDFLANHKTIRCEADFKEFRIENI